jgi:hypothetical protein
VGQGTSWVQSGTESCELSLLMGWVACGDRGHFASIICGMMLPPCSLASSFGELSGEVVGVTYGELQLRGMNLGLLKKESTYKQSPSFRMRVPNVVKITEPGRRYLGVPQELNLMMYGPWSSYPQPELRVELVELKLRSDQGICADRGDVHATMSYARVRM